MPLSVIQIKQAKPKEKDYTLNDGHGLSLLVTSNGSKLWRLRKMVKGKSVLRSLGNFPEVSLLQAREKAAEYSKSLVQGVDPLEVARAATEEASHTFQSVAEEWHKKKSAVWSADHAQRIMRGLSVNIFPWLGSRPINTILAPELLKVIRKLEERGVIETAHRELSTCGQIFRFGIASGYCDRDISADLRGAITPVKHVHHASIKDSKGVAQLLRDIDGYRGTYAVRCALKLSPMLFVRPGELRRMEWAEIDTEAREWRIPAEKMKSRAVHIVPLSAQALAILEDLRPLTGHAQYVFPGRTSDRPMSENTVNAALRYLGYEKTQMTAHGFRSMASTILNEQGWNRDAIERQLAHAERDEVRAAYNHADYLPERRRMMQAWSDYLDALRSGAQIIPIGRASGE